MGQGQSSLDTSREADYGEEEPVKVEGLEDTLHGAAVDAEGDGRHAEVQAAADHILGCQDVLPRVGHQACHVTCVSGSQEGGRDQRPREQAE